MHASIIGELLSPRRRRHTARQEELVQELVVAVDQFFGRAGVWCSLKFAAGGHVGAKSGLVAFDYRRWSHGSRRTTSGTSRGTYCQMTRVVNVKAVSSDPRASPPFQRL